MNHHQQFATQLARQAGILLMDYFKPTGTRVNLKSDHSVVTEADLAVDHLIADAIRTAYPEDGLLSEELQTTLGENVSIVWIVDPLDGTTNFSLGLPIWGVCIARLVEGYPDSAVVYFPALDELCTAETGKGAFRNGEPIQVKPPTPDQPTAFFSCCTRTHRKYVVDLRYKTRILGSASYTWCAVARGAAIIGFEATPKIWDIAAGWLLVNEAKGVIETFDGSQPFPLTPGFDYRQQNFPTLAAATPDLAAKAREQIRLRR